MCLIDNDGKVKQMEKGVERESASVRVMHLRGNDDGSEECVTISEDRGAFDTLRTPLVPACFN